jgi:hypothetical protein
MKDITYAWLGVGRYLPVALGRFERLFLKFARGTKEVGRVLSLAGSSLEELSFTVLKDSEGLPGARLNPKVGGTGT